MIKKDSLGILELTSKDSGFVRRPSANYLPSDDDIYVGRKWVREYNLRTGDEIAGETGKARARERARR